MAEEIRQVYMIKESIGVYGGGIVRAVLTRAGALTKLGYAVTVLTLDENDYGLIRFGLRIMRRLPRNVQILNIYEYYRSLNSRQLPSLWQLPRYSAQHLIGIRDQLRRRLQRVPENPGARMETRHRSGFVAKRVDLCSKSGKPIRTQHFTRDGHCYLEITHDAKGKPAEISLHDLQTERTRYFASLSDFQAHWFDSLCSGGTQKAFVISDSLGTSAPAVLKMDALHCHRIYTVHSNHHADPYTAPAKTRATYLPLLSRLAEQDALVVPTAAQQRDIVAEYGDFQNTYVIPLFNTSPHPRKQRIRGNTVVMVSRYHVDKGLDEAIYAFEHVIRAIPQARLEIYGAGPYKARLLQLVQSRGLSDNILVRGYRVHVDKLYARACTSLLTSKCEGFCLAILESMWNGTPVISYDVPYGPSELIKDGFNGYLVARGDREALAGHIIELLHHPQKARELGENARHYVQKLYSEDIVVQQWVQLFKQLEARVLNSVTPQSMGGAQ